MTSKDSATKIKLKRQFQAVLEEEITIEKVRYHALMVRENLENQMKADFDEELSRKLDAAAVLIGSTAKVIE